MAKLYCTTPNVIFEPYNEPITLDGAKDGSQAKAIELTDTPGAVALFRQNARQTVPHILPFRSGVAIALADGHDVSGYRITAPERLSRESILSN